MIRQLPALLSQAKEGRTDSCRGGLAAALLGLCSLLACQPIEGETSPTPGPSPSPSATPTPASPTPPVPAEVSWLPRSPTEVDLDVSLETPLALTLRFGTSSLDRTMSSPVASSWRFFVYGLSPATPYLFSVESANGVHATGTFTPLGASSGPYRVVFDNAHGQQAGNADWVIDDNAPNPSPASPSSAESWKGAYSSWGYDLHSTGHYELSTRTEPLNAQALSGVDALIVPEPNTPFSSAEISALETYLREGGSMFLMANHWGSDRNNDAWESVSIWEEVLQGFPPELGFSILYEKRSDDPCGNLRYDKVDPVLHGPHGEVRYMGFNGATQLEFDEVLNPSIVGLVWPDGQDQEPTRIFALRARYGLGRILAIGDSAPADDGSGASGDELYNSWDDPEQGQDNDDFHLNGVAWLVGDTQL